MQTKQIALLVVVLIALGLFIGLDLGRFLSFAYLKASQASLTALFEQSPLTVGLVYFLIYLGVASMSLPGAAILTLAGGAIFGFGWGLLLVSFASCLGATASFLAARFVLRESIEARFAQRLADINRGIEKDGAFYLFTLRLIPVVPFFVINLVMGLTHMKTWTFYWVSQVGMLAGTAVYVNAGTQLAGLTSLSGILSPGLLMSFALLGLFPLAAKKWWRASRSARFMRAGKRSDPLDLIVTWWSSVAALPAWCLRTLRRRSRLKSRW